nr:immunoglobulin light chain junction region [Macaca mulatta]MOW12433.1 immunoglobulin light chain junction region [Macaca mulatta]
CVQALQLPYSF